MAKYITRLRRGWKWDRDPDTGLPRDDWAEYDNKPHDERVDPLAGELVVEYDNGIPRLKIGDGIHKFGDLPYMSVDSFILPTPSYVVLYADRWAVDADNRYYQIVTVNNATVTPNSKVDLQPNAEQLSIFHEKDLTFVTENEDGIVSVFCVGQVPQNDYKIQCTLTEVTTNA